MMLPLSKDMDAQPLLVHGIIKVNVQILLVELLRQLQIAAETLFAYQEMDLKVQLLLKQLEVTVLVKFLTISLVLVAQ